MKILNFGSCNLDYVYSMEHIVAPGETESTYKMEIFPGGKGLNQSIAVSKAGAKIYHAGCVGNNGSMLTEILEENGVDISYLKKVESENGHAIIQVSDLGENAILLYPGSNEMTDPCYIDKVLENFGAGDILMLQNEISCVDYIVEKAYEKKICIVLNPSPFNEKIAEISLEKISYIVLNEVEAGAISGCNDPDEYIKYIKNKYPDLKIILTLGSDGCMYADGNCTLYHPAYKVKAVDTTAAGDTFTGYFVAGIATGADIYETLKMASAAAAVSVTRKGAAPSIPLKAEVLRALEYLKSE